MIKERNEINDDDIAEEIVIGIDEKNRTHLNCNQGIDEYKILQSSNGLLKSKKSSTILSEKLFQNE